MIDELNIEAFSEIYTEYIARDFPVNERRPLWNLKALYKRGHYKCMTLKENGEFLAYACFLFSDDIGGVLLDHFAVSSHLRGQGIGASFLAELRNKWDKDGIIIESETPEKAKSDEDRDIRRRRVAFYERCGAVLCPVHWRAFGVDYNLMWLPINSVENDATPMLDIKRLYGLYMPKAALNFVTHISEY